MNLFLPKTVRFLDFKDYDPAQPALAGLGIFVWVDPPRSVITEYDRINREFSELLKAASSLPKNKLPWWRRWLKPKSIHPASFLDLLSARKKLARDPALEAYHRQIHAWYSNLWSQGAEGTHIPAADVAELDAQNPAFLEWLQRASWQLIEGHRANIKKGLRPPEPKPPATGEPATGSSRPISQPSTSTGQPEGA